MNRFFLSILFSFLFAGIGYAQTTADTVIRPTAGSTLQQDSIVPDNNNLLPELHSTDSVCKRPANYAIWRIDPGISFSSSQYSWEILKHHPYFGFNSVPVSSPASAFRKVNGKEYLFYLLVLLFIIFAFLRIAFPKYFGDLFRLFFRTTLKQRQIREQLMQTPLPSLLLNGFFVVSGSLYISFLIEHYQLNPVDNFWLLFLYCSLGLSAAYFVKFAGLKVSGWLFNMSEAADSCIFIVFIVNKMIGILLLPFLMILAFSLGDVYSVGLTVSWCLVGALLAYRFILTYGAIRNQVKVNPFHFFLYLCAFEIAPLLLVYKGLLLFFRITA